jgi:hypothetical protein
MKRITVPGARLMQINHYNLKYAVELTRHTTCTSPAIRLNFWLPTLFISSLAQPG